VGSLLIGFFADPAFFGGEFGRGLFYGGGTRLLLEQTLANAATIVYSFAVTFAIMKALAVTLGVRVPDDTEDTGLDLAEHGETAYPFGDALVGTSAAGPATPTTGGKATVPDDTDVRTPIV
jgi:Amt family ammonium transporter